MNLLQAFPLALSEAMAAWLPWLVAGAIVVLGLVVLGWKDLLRLHGRRIWALSDVCYTEAIRRRILWVTPLAIIGVIVVAQLSRPGDAQDAIRQATKFCLFASGFLVTVTAIILACTNLPREIENRVIYSVVTKPTTRLEIVLGKVLGFARVSGAIIIIMGAFTYGYLKIRSWGETNQVRKLLASLPTQSPERPALEHYIDVGFLGTLSLDDPQKLEILGHPSEGEGKTKWMLGAQGEYLVVPFELNEDQKAVLSEAADHGSVYLMTTLRVRQHEPDEDERKLIKQMGLDRQPVELPLNRPLGPEVPSTQPSTAPAEPQVTGPPPPQVNVRILDQTHRPLIGSADAASGDAVVLKKPDKPEDAWYAPLPLQPEMLKRMITAPQFFVQVTATAPATEYGADQQPVALVVPMQGKPMTIFPSLKEKAGATVPPEFFSFPARHGMRLQCRGNGVGPVAVYHFNHASIGRTSGGRSTLQVRVNVEKNGDVDATGSGYAMATIQVINRQTGKTMPPLYFPPEVDQTRYVDVPVEFVEGGNFDVLLRGMTPNMWLGVTPDSVSVVVADQSFLVNLAKSLLMLWLLSVMVITIAVFCSTFLSWPIAVVCTLVILLGHWGVEQLGDAMRPGVGRAFTQDFQLTNSALRDTLNTAVDSLAAALRVISNFLPDVSKFPVTEYIDRGVSIPLASFGGAFGVLFCYALPLLVLSYVILRNKEVAP